MPDPWSPNGHDDVGPFSGREIGEALETLGWELEWEPEPGDAAEYRKRGVDNEIHINLDRRNVYWGDPVLGTIAENMVDRLVAGRTRRRATEKQKRALLRALHHVRRR